MALTHDTETERLTSRQREALERRNRMTQRRQELTSRIRKQKKSKYLQKKRSVPRAGAKHSVSSGIPVTTKVEFRDLLESYCQNSISLEQLLTTLERFVSDTKDNTFPKFGTTYSTPKSDIPLVILEQNDEGLAVKALDCLRKQTVAFISKQETLSFQISLRILVHLTSISSCDGIGSSSMTDYYGCRPSTWSELLVSRSASHSTSSTPSWVEILVQALFSSREVELTVELTSLVLGNLVGDDSAARNIFHTITDDFKTSLVTGLIRSVSPATPTAAWTLTNMIRNDSISYASSYCSESLLSSTLLMTWLREPSLATQTAWMIASLTAREEETVDYLCGKLYTNREKEFSFLSAIIKSVQKPLQQDQTVPLVQSLGNLACRPSLVAPLLTQTSPSLIPLLQHILNATSSRDPVLMQGAWLAGCLLVDVGIENHPSTTLAAPTLIPILIERLGRGSENKRMGNQPMAFMTLEEEREFACALCNALESPPAADNREGQHQLNPYTSSHSFQQSFNLNLSSSTIQSLVRLINSNDIDAAVSGVNLVDLLLRRFNEERQLKTIMQEEGLPDALDRICDSPMHEAANVAAEILDDFFYDDGHYDTGATESFWTNGLPNSASPAFGAGVENGAINGTGRGRGRGATIPAWMTN